MSATLLLVLIVSLTGIDAQAIQCPRCSDAYDPASCTEMQNCNNYCVLHLHTVGIRTVEFTCSSSSPCHDDCGNNQGTCTECCGSFEACSNRLRELVPDMPSTRPPTRASTHTYHSTTHSPVTQAHTSIAHTAIGLFSTRPPIQASTHISHSTAHLPGTPAHTNIAHTATGPTHAPLSTVHAQPAHTCVQCGDFGTDLSCTAVQLLLNKPTACPVGLPYCYETINVIGGNVKVSKGCAEHNFCRVEWDIGHSRTGCYPVDVTKDLVCTYCCRGNACNSITPPLDQSLVTFP